MEEAKETLEKFFKKFGKRFKKILLIVLVMVCFLIILLPSVVYWLTVDDGTYDEGDWSSIPYAVGQYTNAVSINSDGTLSSDITTQELWDKMIQSNSRVDEYLDSPEELARLMKAEIVTQYPDTRPENEIDTPIDWKKIFEEEPDTLQGIIKFKRADSNNHTATMTYVDSNTFYDWIELYAQTGNEYYKNQALTHFTLSKNQSTSNNSDTASNYTTNDMKTDYSDAIVKAAKEIGSPGADLCQKWVRLVYAKAGLGNASYATAYEAFKNNCVSTSKDNIPIGAAVYGTGSGSSAGHVGIYIGKDINGIPMVMDNIGFIRTQSLDEWIAWQEKNPTAITGEMPGWLGWGWQSGSPKILDTESNDNNQNDSNDSTTEETTNNDEVTTEQTTAKASYTVVIATWQQTDTTITTNDPNVKGSSQTQYTMTTTNVNYEEVIKNYTMPFDLLWAFLVVGEDRDFVFELADLVYGSDIQITIHDNLTVNTDVDEWNYTQRTKAIVNADIIANCKAESLADSIKNDVHEPHKEEKYKTTKTVITQTNTVDVALTRANTWIVDYQNDYTYVAPKETTTTKEVKKDDEEYKQNPDSIGDSYTCGHINAKKEELEKKIRELTGQPSDFITDMENGTTQFAPFAPVIFNEKIKVEYYNKYINISDTVTNKVNTQEYTQGTPTIKEKTDPEAEEENFSTIFNKYEYRKNKSNIKDVSEWLFEIIETNESTANMADLVRYLLYKATGTSYGVKEYDFNIFYPGTLTEVGDGDYVVHIDKSSPDIVINDVETLKKAFAGYSGSSKLIEHAQEFLDMQRQYKVNAVFAAAVSITETSAGRAGHATDGCKNWFNMTGTDGPYKTTSRVDENGVTHTYNWRIYESDKEGIAAFGKFIANPSSSYYFAAGNYSVSAIGLAGYCENAGAPGGWIDTTVGYMTQMFEAAGIDTSTSSVTSKTGETVVTAAREKLGCPYVWGATGPNTFDCSGLTQWCYKKAGISIPRVSEDQKKGAKKLVSVTEARVRRYFMERWTCWSLYRQ